MLGITPKEIPNSLMRAQRRFRAPDKAFVERNGAAADPKRATVHQGLGRPTKHLF